MECDITIMEFFDIQLRDASGCHGRDQSCEFFFRLGSQVLSGLSDRDCLKRDAYLLNQSVLFSAKLRHICPAFKDFPNQTLMFQFVQSFTQCRLTDTQPRSPFLFDDSVSSAEFSRDHGLANGLSCRFWGSWD